MLSWSGVGAIAGIIAVLIVVASVLGQLRISRNQTNLANYRDAAQSWEARATALKEENAAQQAAIDELRAHLLIKDKEIGELRGQMAVLQNLITGKTLFETFIPELHNVRDEILTAIKGARQ